MPWKVPMCISSMPRHCAFRQCVLLYSDYRVCRTCAVIGIQNWGAAKPNVLCLFQAKPIWYPSWKNCFMIIFLWTRYLYSVHFKAFWFRFFMYPVKNWCRSFYSLMKKYLNIEVSDFCFGETPFVPCRITICNFRHDAISTDEYFFNQRQTNVYFFNAQCAFRQRVLLRFRLPCISPKSLRCGAHSWKKFSLKFIWRYS